MKSENKGLVDYVDLLARITFFFSSRGGAEVRKFHHRIVFGQTQIKKARESVNTQPSWER